MITYPENDIINCTLCPLSGINYAFPRVQRGEGKKVMFIGEAPGREEAKHHIAFVGRSGKLLNEWINTLGITNYIITNIVRHRPVKDNRDRQPTAGEIEACFPHLATEILNEKPDFIILLGRSAMRGFKTYMGSEHLNGIRWEDPIKYVMPKTFSNTLRISLTYEIQDATGTVEMKKHPRVFVIWHPSYILRGYSTEGNLEKLKEQLGGEDV